MDTFVAIPNFDGYFINRDGAILSKIQKKERILKQGIGNNGYYRVNLGRRNSRLVHRLLALTFIPNPNNLPFIDHVDRNPLNNSLDNLRWVSPALNAQNKSKRKDNISGHKHIHFVGNRKRVARWAFTIIRNKTLHSKHFKTLAEAIEYRDAYILSIGEEIVD